MSSEEDKRVRLHNYRAKYLRKASPETIQAIMAQARKLYEARPQDGMEAAMELAVHQQQTLDWMAAHPRGKTDAGNQEPR